MKKITYFYLPSCPHCKRADTYIEQLKEKLEYQDIEIERIDERASADIAEKYDYWYVPTFYVGEEKIHEGTAGLEDIRKVFEAALNVDAK